MSKFVLLAVVIVLQVCWTKAENVTEPEGALRRIIGAYKEMKTKVVDAGTTVVDFFEMYYEDQVKPKTDPYIEWAKEKAQSFWDKLKTKVSGDGDEN
ncbi:apolipoprotein C-IV [Clarias gariepinus]|uniref:apolipoprotein C-IV n=1 Tax=Clarias gariepinus TaxID=13013 RepID=UPI00234D0018|nr:apolipoprotein C-IV [Clarias gariepinus]